MCQARKPYQGTLAASPHRCGRKKGHKGSHRCIRHGCKVEWPQRPARKAA
jgi:hypothetical protein